MKFEITPYVGAGRLLFGMDRAAVRQTMDARFVVSHRGEFSAEKDIFAKLGVLANYDDDDRLYVVEFADPAEPILAGVNLLGESANAVKALLQLMGGDLKEDESGAGSRKLGIEVWIPYADEAEQPGHSILVAGPGYYEKHPWRWA